MVPEFTNRYKSKVAKYVNQTAELNNFAKRQFTLLLLRNTRLSSSTMNVVTFRMSTKSKSSMVPANSIDISLDTDEAAVVKNCCLK